MSPESNSDNSGDNNEYTESGIPSESNKELEIVGENILMLKADYLLSLFKQLKNPNGL